MLALCVCVLDFRRFYKMSAPVILEWRNLNLTIKKREFKFLKCETQTKESRIIENGKNSVTLIYTLHRQKEIVIGVLEVCMSI